MLRLRSEAMSSESTSVGNQRAKSEAEVLACLRELAPPLSASLFVEWHAGEIRMRDAQGVVRVRVVPRARGDCHVDLDPLLGTVADATRVAKALGALTAGGALPWIAHAGELPWQTPFDRGPGVYALSEMEGGDVSAAVLGALDVRIVYVEASCSADCVFCGHLDSLSDGVAERLTLDAVRAGAIDVRGAWVCLGGPEPTENELIAEYVRACHVGGATAIAMIATAEGLAQPGRAAALRSSGLEALSLPIYGVSAHVHDAVVRRPGAHARLLRTVDAVRAAGLDVYLHTLVLAHNASELPQLAAWAKDAGLPLCAGLPRRKGEVTGYYPSSEQLASACAALPVLGAPLCLRDIGGDSPGAVEASPPLPLGGAQARKELARVGPMLVYFTLQAGDFGAPCGECAARSRCWGAPRGTLPIWGPHLLPLRA